MVVVAVDFLLSKGFQGPRGQRNNSVSKMEGRGASPGVWAQKRQDTEIHGMMNILLRRGKKAHDGWRQT